MTICYAYKEGNCREEFTTHIDRTLRTWAHIKKYYYRGVARAYPTAGSADLVEFAILTHDLGKLARHYQAGRPGLYRHEVVSAYFAYAAAPAWLSEEDKAALAAAVMLHHEPIMLSAYVAKLGERYLPIYVVKKALEEVDLSFGCGEDVVQYFQSKNADVGKALAQWRDKGLHTSEVLNVVKKIVVLHTVGEPSRLQALRAKVAALLHPLVVSDSVAAHIGRGCGEGTVISRRALGGAEVLDEKKLREELRP